MSDCFDARFHQNIVLEFVYHPVVCVNDFKGIINNLWRLVREVITVWRDTYQDPRAPERERTDLQTPGDQCLSDEVAY